MKTKPRILVVGSLVMDLICSTPRFPKSGETIIGTTFSTAPGGKGANQAVQAARLGANVTMVGKVGKDAFSEQMKQSLAAAGVNIDGILCSNTCSTGVGNIQLEVTEQGTANRILVLPGANMDLTVDDLAELEKTIATYDMLILQLEIPMKVNVAAAKLAHAHGVPVMLNSAPSAPLPDDLLSCLSYISPNEHEASDMTGIAVKDIPSAKQAVQYLRNKGVQNVLITMGSQGAVFSDGEHFLSSPCVDYGPVVDPTAAGDSFVAAFCTAICLGDTPENALLFANHTAGITVSRMGAQPSLPVLDEVVAFMKTNGHDVTQYV
ncbi:MAG: ribokinase [Clostridia bacterium]|nr:ribokinase [Clostridia bacterium]